MSYVKSIISVEFSSTALEVAICSWVKDRISKLQHSHKSAQDTGTASWGGCLWTGVEQP